MKGIAYPAGKEGKESVIRDLYARVGMMEKPMLDQVQRYPQIELLRERYKLLMIEDVLGYSVALGDEYGLPLSFREACFTAITQMNPMLSDLDMICMQQGINTIEYKEGRIYARFDPQDPLMKIHLLHPLLSLRKNPARKNLQEADLITELQKCTAHWLTSVSEVLLSSLPEENEPEKVTFGGRTERIYQENVELNWLNFHLSHGRVGREIIAKRASIAAGDTVIDVGSGSGWMLPHIARYKPKKIYVSEIDIFPELDHLAGTLETDVERVYDFNKFTKPVDIAICSQASFLDRALVRNMSRIARKGIVVGVAVDRPVKQYLFKDYIDPAIVVTAGPKIPANLANGELKRLEEEALAQFKDVEITQYKGRFIVSARNRIY